MDKEDLKKLREERKATIERAKNLIKTQTRHIKQIKELIKDQGKTIPQIALAGNMPTSQVLLYVAALRKYGMVAEGQKEEGYFRYILVS